jgi:hypothetical protein
MVAGRYGYQLPETAKSYTQTEYEYARDIGKRRLAFLHRYPDRVNSERTDRAGTGARKLKAFRHMLEEDLLVQYWERSGDELARKVVSSLNSEVLQYPQVGWVRGDSVTAIAAEALALSGIESRQFDNRADFWLYAAERIRDSKSVDDLTWGMVYPTAERVRDKEAYEVYRRAIRTASAGRGRNKGNLYREIMSFPNELRLRRAAPLLDNEKYPNFQLKCFDYDHGGTPPLLQFYVFDKKEVLISLTPLTGTATDSRYMTFKNEQLASLMSDYFEAAWRDAIVLKDLGAIQWDRLKDIARRLGSDIFDASPPQDYTEREVP